MLTREELVVIPVLLAALSGFGFSIGCNKKTEPISLADANQLFESTCARCHGLQGTGGAPAAPGAPAPRNFHDSAFQKARTDDDIRRVITTGKPPHMPTFGGTLKEEQIQGLVPVIRSFNPEPPAAASRN